MNRRAFLSLGLLAVVPKAKAESVSPIVFYADTDSFVTMDMVSRYPALLLKRFACCPLHGLYGKVLPLCEAPQSRAWPAVMYSLQSPPLGPGPRYINMNAYYGKRAR